ncbi:MAG: phytoene desaturase family protein, partial [Terriglobales bacterium]
GTAAVLERSGEQTAERLGEDAGAYRRLIAPVAADWPALEADALAAPHWPRHPLALARFGWRALRPARGLAQAMFRTAAARALFAGLAAHAAVPLEEAGSSAIALMLAGAAHRAGWPLARGGSQALAQALAGCLRSLGGEIETSHPVGSLAELPAAATIFCDVSPRGLLALAGDRLRGRYRRRLQRYSPGPGVFKLDYALRAPIPWSAEECRTAGTVHLGGTLEEVAASERLACAARGGRSAPQPFVLLSQASLFDSSRAPAGGHTAWAYCHVPNGSAEDMVARIEAQIERFAPGFAQLVLARCARAPAELERHNANLVGGDITGGRNSLGQLLLRPGLRPYRTPLPGVYLCSASTPPGGGVHGLCGFHAAREALGRAE